MTINLQFIFITSLISKKKTSGCQMKEKSCLKASAWLELAVYLNLLPSAFKSKINELLLVNFLDLETSHVIIIRKKFSFDLNFKTDKP